MEEQPQSRPSQRAAHASPGEAGPERQAWQAPAFRVIPLDCEITAYAPDGDDPLF